MCQKKSSTHFSEITQKSSSSQAIIPDLHQKSTMNFNKLVTIFFLPTRHRRLFGSLRLWSLQIPYPRRHEHQCFPNATACGSTRNRCSGFDWWNRLHHGERIHFQQEGQIRVMPLISSIIPYVPYDFFYHFLAVHLTNKPHS